MKINGRTFLALATVALIAPTTVQAQRPGGQGPGARQGQGMRGDAMQHRGPRAGMQRGGGVEGIMRMRERLDLTEDQVSQLDAVRRETVAERSARQAEMAELRSRVEAGQMERSALREMMEGRREAHEALSSAHRERIQSILTEDQRAQVERLVGQARAFQRGRASAMRGSRGMRGERGFRGGQGRRGPGGSDGAAGA